MYKNRTFILYENHIYLAIPDTISTFNPVSLNKQAIYVCKLVVIPIPNTGNYAIIEIATPITVY
jgi:hypothetical protein